MPRTSNDAHDRLAMVASRSREYIVDDISRPAGNLIFMYVRH